MKKQFLALISVLFISNVYGENLTILFERRSSGTYLTIISDDQEKVRPDPIYVQAACWPRFGWHRDGTPMGELAKGSSLIWPRISRDLKNPEFESVLSYFSSKGYRLINGYQRVRTNYVNEKFNSTQDVLIFSKPDAKR